MTQTPQDTLLSTLGRGKQCWILAGIFQMSQVSMHQCSYMYILDIVCIYILHVCVHMIYHTCYMYMYVYMYVYM